MSFNADIGRNIRIARMAKGFTQARVADALDWTQSNVSQLEAGRIAPSAETLAIIGNLLGVPIDLLYPPPAHAKPAGRKPEAKAG